MREFDDDDDRWVATALEEQTPRHHGRWYLAFHPASAPERVLPVPEVRWQSAHTAERTLATMAEFELRRRLIGARRRTGDAASEGDGSPS